MPAARPPCERRDQTRLARPGTRAGVDRSPRGGGTRPPARGRGHRWARRCGRGPGDTGRGPVFDIRRTARAGRSDSRVARYARSGDRARHTATRAAMWGAGGEGQRLGDGSPALVRLGRPESDGQVDFFLKKHPRIGSMLVVRGRTPSRGDVASRRPGGRRRPWGGRLGGVIGSVAGSRPRSRWGRAGPPKARRPRLRAICDFEPSVLAGERKRR